MVVSKVKVNVPTADVLPAMSVCRTSTVLASFDRTKTAGPSGPAVNAVLHRCAGFEIG